MDNKPLSYVFFIASLFYAPVINPYFPKTHFGSGIPDFGLVEICLIMWVLTLFLDLMLRQFTAVSKSGSGGWVFVLGLYTAIIISSVLWSVESYSLTNVRDLFFTVIVPFQFAILTKYYIGNPAVVRGLVLHAMISCTALSVIGCFHFIMSQSSQINELRAGVGGLANPNAMAIFLVMNVPIILYGALSGLCSKKSAFISLFIMTFGVCSTISRKGLITFGMSFILFLTLTKRVKVLVIFLLFFSIVAGAVISQKQMSQRYSKENVNKEFVGKWHMSLAGFDMFTKKPLIGWGYKGYYNNFGKYFKNSVAQKYEAHNNYVTALANYGIVGFIPFILIFLYPVFLALKQIIRRGVSLPPVFLIVLILPFMTSAWFAGKLMYLPIVTNLFYVYIVLFLCCGNKTLEEVRNAQL